MIISPVLGESVSMYEREGERSEDMRLYENILDRVQRLLATEENKETTTEAGVVNEKKEEEVKQVDPQAATWDRLRQLGVSFISPGDLGSASTSDQGQDTLWLPQARLPASSAQPRLSPDASLAMNDLALKYLTDAELGQLAAVHQPKEKNGKNIYNQLKVHTFPIKTLLQTALEATWTSASPVTSFWQSMVTNSYSNNNSNNINRSSSSQQQETSCRLLVLVSPREPPRPTRLGSIRPFPRSRSSRG